MNFFKILLLSVIIISITSVFAQEKLIMSPNVAEAFENGTRNEDGYEGENYWANKPSYYFDIDFNPTTSLLSGSGKIVYENNSPDTLNRVTIALLGNIYKKFVMHDWAINPELTHDGTVITTLKYNGNSIDIKSKNFVVSGTNLYLKLDNPILPSSDATFELEWHVLYPEGAVIRSGNYGDSTFFISYFYPKIAVYDDIDGWDNSQYTGYTEFYGEYSDFLVNITLPGDFFLWATGEIQNPKDVYNKKIYDRWQKAIQSDTVMSIIKKEDLGKPETIISMSPKKWTFKASNVTDFAFSCSNGFLWDCRSVEVDKYTKRRSIVNAAYLPSSLDYVEVAQIAAEALHNFSNKIPGVPYPYPVMSVCNGHAGMEFPMMCNDASQSTRIKTVGLTYHEIAHSYFPFYVGINERKYAWMDEGWASFFPAFYAKNYNSDFKTYFERFKDGYEDYAGDEGEAPMIMTSKAIKGRTAYRQASYRKSFLAYYYLMDYLGDTEFLHALRKYMNTWNGKHPIPQDFFNSMNHHSGRDLNWFWNSWFMKKNHADLAIGGVNKTGIEILNIGQLFMPISLEITMKNGDVLLIDKKMDVWRGNPYSYQILLESPAEIISVKLGDWNIVDVDNSNNYLEVK